MSYGIAIVGAGILGLAHAYEAARRGLKVIVIDKDAQANGASIRNFGFVTITGQKRGHCWQIARRTRDVWAEIAPKAGIKILQRGLMMTARRPEAEAVIEEFSKTEMGEGCYILDSSKARSKIPELSPSVTMALYSTYDLRIESLEAIPKLTLWLEKEFGVEFRWQTPACEINSNFIKTPQGKIKAEAIIVCSGDDFSFVSKNLSDGLTRCKLHMMRLSLEKSTCFSAVIMSDLGMTRYSGYADLPSAQALKLCLDKEQKAQIENGVHLIVTQSADGSLIVGDSHHYSDTPDPFQPLNVDNLILEELNAVLNLSETKIINRWTGTYASAKKSWLLREKIDMATELVMVTQGCGMSTAFGIAEETFEKLI